MIKIAGKKGQTSEELVEEVKGALSKTPETPAFQVDDITKEVTKHLRESVIDKLKTKVTKTADVNYQVRYLGIKAPSTKVTETAERLAKQVNKYVLAFNTVGQLGDFIRYDLYFGPENMEIDKEPQSLYLAYIAVSHQAAEVIDTLIKNKLGSPFFQEGGIPDTKDDNE